MQDQASSGDYPQPSFTPPPKLQDGLMEAPCWVCCSLEHPGPGCSLPQGAWEECPPHTSSARLSKALVLSPLSPLLSQVKTQLQAQTVAAMAVGHQHHHQVGLSFPRAPWAGWAPGLAGAVQ